MKPLITLVAVGLLGLAASSLDAAAPAEVKLIGDWEIHVSVPDNAKVKPANIKVEPNTQFTVTAQKYASLPIYKTTGGGWARGVQLTPLKAQETTRMQAVMKNFSIYKAVEMVLLIVGDRG